MEQTIMVDMNLTTLRIIVYILLHKIEIIRVAKKHVSYIACQKCILNMQELYSESKGERYSNPYTNVGDIAGDLYRLKFKPYSVKG